MPRGVPVLIRRLRMPHLESQPQWATRAMCSSAPASTSRAGGSVAIETLQPNAKGLDHRTVWRWHFYAGLFCIPFVLWLSLTGTIFLFHPQIQHWLDRPFDHLTITQRASANTQVQAALAAMPGTTFDSYELPHSPTSAAQVLLDKGTQQF